MHINCSACLDGVCHIRQGFPTHWVVFVDLQQSGSHYFHHLHCLVLLQELQSQLCCLWVNVEACLVLFVHCSGFIVSTTCCVQCMTYSVMAKCKNPRYLDPAFL